MVYNIFSLILGFLAWATAILAVLVHTAPMRHRLSLGSYSLCCLSLLSQFCNIRHLCAIHDISAIYDTIGATVFAAVTLCGVTLFFNFIALCKAERSH